MQSQLGIMERKSRRVKERERLAMDAYKMINDILVNLINEIWRLEEKAIITEEFRDLTNNDMHIMEAIAPGDGNNMSTIAKKMNVTVGTLTTSINGLVRKKYVERYRSESDRRVVYVKLTEKGIAAYHHHEDYHRQLTRAVLEKLDEDEIPVLIKMLDGVTEFFRGYSAKAKCVTEEKTENDT